MRRLYTFNLNQISIVEKPIEKDIDGQKVKVLEKFENIAPFSFVIKRPSREDSESAQDFHDQKLGEDVRNGVITHNELIKRFTNENTEIGNVYKEYAVKEIEYQKLVTLEDKTPENIARKDKLEQELLQYLNQIKHFEFSQEIFNSTAESRTRNKTLLWWVLNLSYDDKNEPFFAGKTFEEKLDNYDKIMESEHADDKFRQEVVSRFLYFILFWYQRQLAGRTTTERDFIDADDTLKKELQKEKEEVKKQKELKSAPNLEHPSEDKKE